MTPAVRSRAGVVVLGLVLAAVLAACASDDPAPKPAQAPPTGPTATGPSPTTGPTGAEPAEPVERSGFHGKIDELPAGLAAEMRGTTWHPGCPVPLDARFPIKRVSLSTPFHPKAFAQHRRIDSNRSVTASFNCRPVVTALGPGGDFSQHAYGLAIDLNPLQNPYVTSDGFVRNRAAEPYTDRSRDLEGMIHEGDVVFRSFAAIGWEWGGNWNGDKDYMHFSLTGS